MHSNGHFAQRQPSIERYPRKRSDAGVNIEMSIASALRRYLGRGLTW